MTAKKGYFIRRWGCSSVGRALEWHSRGRRFDPVQLHLSFLITYLSTSFLITRYPMQYIYSSFFFLREAVYALVCLMQTEFCYY